MGFEVFFATDFCTLTICQQQMPSEEDSKGTYKKTSNTYLKIRET